MPLLITCLLCSLVMTSPPAHDATVRSVHRPEMTPGITQWIDDNLPELLAFYRERHAAPELSGQEETSSAAIAERLSAAGFDVTTRIGGFGVAAVLANGDGPTVLIRGDMDALPITEATGLSYASSKTTKLPDGTTTGVMHACGHDIHMTNLVGTAELLAAMSDSWRGTVIAIAQPAEEIGVGALAMISDSLFERVPRPDFCLGWHIMPHLAAGTVGHTSGWATANVDSVDITIFGRGGHGSQPHKAVDPVVAAAQVIVSLQTIVSRRVDPLAAAVITVGSVHAGTKHNIIPEEAELQLTVRSFDDDVRRTLLDSIRQVTLNTCRAMGCPHDPQVVVLEDEFTPSGYNHPELAAAATRVMAEVIGTENLVRLAPLTIGEDFSRYSRHLEVPGLILWLGTTNAADLTDALEAGQPLPALHTPTLAPDAEPALRTGIGCTAAIVLSLLEPAG